MSQILPQKRSAALDNNNNMSSTRPRPYPPADNVTEDSSSQRYNRLLSILNKSFSQSRTKIESDGPALIKEVYGDMTSLFGGDNDNDNDDGVTQLVNLLLGKLDTVHDRFKDETTTSVNNMEKLLSQHHIQPLLSRVEMAIDKVEKADEEFNRLEEADKKSALAAVESARTGGSNAQKFTEYYTYQLKQEYLNMLQGELDTVTSDNEKMDNELQEKWGEWMEDLKEVKNALALLTQLGSSVGNDEEDEKEGGRGVDP
jgi:hypothetical protein